MVKSISNIILTIAAVLIIAGSFIGGCCFHRYGHVCPVASIDTVIVHDTITHIIVDTFPYYIVRNDTIIYRDTVPGEIDTAALLRDYYALHVYNRKWNDSIIELTLLDTITENKPVSNLLKYKINRPQTIVNISVDSTKNYGSYITIGADVPIMDVRYTTFEAQYIWSRAYVGIGYTPQLKSINASAGITLFKFNKKK